MGRREDREALQATWTVLEAREPGTPFSRKDIEDSAAREEARRAFAARGSVYAPADEIPADEIPQPGPRTYLPALARAAQYTPSEADQVPMPK